MREERGLTGTRAYMGIQAVLCAVNVAWLGWWMFDRAGWFGAGAVGASLVAGMWLGAVLLSWLRG